ncbi:MAG: class I SAM-dependent methyltransferase [Methanobacteriota archaeon]|nr:MAG: class I SAM-dependent methyltransferase [Euryarchaeota archaeon]
MSAMKKANLQSQWDDSAEAWVDFVRSGKDYFRDHLNNPAMFEVLGDISGKKILDLACGEGYNSRMMAKKGADVTGVDFSEKMIGLAIQEENRNGLGINYAMADATDLHIFKNNSFDIVACFLALQDIEDYRIAIKETARVLKNRGRFVFGITHPCFESRTIEGKQVAGWMYSSGFKRKAKEVSAYLRPEETAQYFVVDRYFDTHSEIIQWRMERLIIHFETTAFHRTLTDYANALNDAGFLISRLKEPRPTKKGVELYPIMEEINRIPHSIIFETVKS